MTIKNTRNILRAGAALAMTCGTMAAHAQDGAAAGADQTSESAVPEIVVTGIRGSLLAAQELKRTAPSVVEAITSADLGRFTDTTLADALQRVPGVQISRNVRGSAGYSGVTIRGLGPQFVITTLDGRSMLGTPTFAGTGGAREFDFDTVSPELISGLVVYKSPTADLIEPGLAGEVNIQTLRPLDQKKDAFASISLGGQLSERRNKVGERLSGIAGVKLLDGKLGLYVAGLFSDEYRREKQEFNYGARTDIAVRNSDGSITEYKDVFAVQEGDSNVSDIHYRRRSIASGLQFKPDNHLEVNINGLWSNYKSDRRESVFQNYAGYSLSGTTFSAGGATVRDGAVLGYDSGKAIDGPLSTTNGYGPGSGAIVGGKDINRIVTWTAGANVKYTGDKITITADYAHNKTNNRIDFGNGYWISSQEASKGLAAIYDYSGSKPRNTFYTINTPGNLALYPNTEDASNQFATYYDQDEWRASRDQYRLDAEWRPNDWLTLKAGGREEKTLVQQMRAVVDSAKPFYDYTDDDGKGYYSTRGFLTGRTERLGEGGAGEVPTASWAGFAASNRRVTSVYNFGKGNFAQFPTSAEECSASNPSNVVSLECGSGYRLSEKITSFYAEAIGDGEIAGLPVSGNIGVRRVRVRETSTGFTQDKWSISQTGGATLNDPVNYPQYLPRTSIRTDSNTYSRWLPSANLLIRPTPQLNLRFSYAKTLTLPGYTDLDPSRKIVNKLVNPDLNILEPNFATGGNTRLKPTTGDNYDITLEYYTPNGGAIIISGFDKELKNFITFLSERQIKIPDHDALYDVTSSVNGGKGYSRGFEVGTNQPFTFLPSPFDGLGVNANYTYVASKQRIPTTNGTIESSLPGTSKQNFNATAYYEKYGFGLRVAYSHRSDYVVGVGSVSNNGIIIDREYIRGLDLIDLSISQKINDKIEAIVTATNITGEKQIHYWGKARLLAQVLPISTTYALAVRVKF
jgi:TonB-dependent receptor